VTTRASVMWAARYRPASRSDGAASVNVMSMGTCTSGKSSHRSESTNTRRSATAALLLALTCCTRANMRAKPGSAARLAARVRRPNG
jgi:hypothetical protein